jgi:hypothetical protein
MTEQKPENLNTEKELKEQIEYIYSELIKKPEISEALILLEKLPQTLKYHSKDHTIDVIKETILFALGDGASQSVIEQQAIAAAWHDVGYTEGLKNHEEMGVKLFQQSEAFQKLSKEQSDEIIANISDTKLKVEGGSPSLSMKESVMGYILDADVSNFGREDFFKKMALLTEELGIDWNNLNTRKAFIKFTIYLLKNHQWKTESAKRMRQQTKEKNIGTLVKEYNDLGEQLDN